MLETHRKCAQICVQMQNDSREKKIQIWMWNNAFTIINATIFFLSVFRSCGRCILCVCSLLFFCFFFFLYIILVLAGIFLFWHFMIFVIFVWVCIGTYTVDIYFFVWIFFLFRFAQVSDGRRLNSRICCIIIILCCILACSLAACVFVKSFFFRCCCDCLNLASPTPKQRLSARARQRAAD